MFLQHLLFIYNIKILVLVVSFLNEFEYVILRVITFVSINMSMMFIISFSLFSINQIDSNSTSTFVSLSLTFCYLETSFSSVSLSSEFFLDSSSDEKDSFKILDSFLLESFSSSPIILSR